MGTLIRKSLLRYGNFNFDTILSKYDTFLLTWIRDCAIMIHMEVYIRPEDKLFLGNTPLTSIQYLFSYGELMAVAIEANIGEATNILSIFTERYGTPIQPNRFLEKYEWKRLKNKNSIRKKYRKKYCQCYYYVHGAVETDEHNSEK